MSITRSIEFYCGRKNIPTTNIFGMPIMTYEFSKDIAYTNIDFCTMANELRAYMVKNNIKNGYCDISVDMGGGYSLIKRYTYINKTGNIITKGYKYGY